MREGRKPKLAIWKFASCDGCQLSLLDCEDELLTVAQAMDIAYFPEGFREVIKGPYDISLIEGSITTSHDEERIHKIRRNSKIVVAIGACATSGGIQALRNFGNVEEYIRLIYAKPEYIDVLNKSTPISDHIRVDYELRGCPINKFQLLEIVGALIQFKRPSIPSYSVCMECKRKGNICVAVAHGTPCLGPVTQAGCGAICPTYNRGCYACFGPKETPNTESLGQWWNDRLGVKEVDIMRAFRGFNAYAEAFRRESEAHEV
jgi:sulfhydrogenase subunit delta